MYRQYVKRSVIFIWTNIHSFQDEQPSILYLEFISITFWVHMKRHDLFITNNINDALNLKKKNRYRELPLSLFQT